MGLGKEKDGPNDKASNVDREGVYRLNPGISKTTFIEFFGFIPVMRASCAKIRKNNKRNML
jgi:uncharacterized protein DUF6194